MVIKYPNLVVYHMVEAKKGLDYMIIDKSVEQGEIAYKLEVGQYLYFIQYDLLEQLNKTLRYYVEVIDVNKHGISVIDRFINFGEKIYLPWVKEFEGKKSNLVIGPCGTMNNKPNKPIYQLENSYTLWKNTGDDNHGENLKNFIKSGQLNLFEEFEK